MRSSDLDRISSFLRRQRARARRPLGAALVLAGGVLLCTAASHRAVGIWAQSEARQALSSPSAGAPPATLRDGDPIGRIAIPRVGMDLAVFEGSSDGVLRKGPGHLSGTRWPGISGARGNCVIAGHRDSFFRKLSGVRAGDAVILADGRGSYAYRLVSSRVVTPEETAVAGPTSDERLTLLSCYPFGWTGHAPYRIVWTARRASPHGSGSRSKPAAGRPPEQSTALR